MLTSNIFKRQAVVGQLNLLPFHVACMFLLHFNCLKNTCYPTYHSSAKKYSYLSLMTKQNQTVPRNELKSLASRVTNSHNGQNLNYNINQQYVDSILCYLRNDLLLSDSTAL